MDAPKVIEQEEVVNLLQKDIEAAFDTFDKYIEQVGHSEAKRAYRASMRYPAEKADFSKESEAMIRLYSASKTVIDALVAMGVEVVIKQVFENQQRLANAGRSEDDTIAEPRTNETKEESHE